VSSLISPIALAWCFPDETSEYADRVLVALEDHTILVSAVWCLELANAILVGERKKRLNQPEIKSRLRGRTDSVRMTLLT
jgi:hypothetical protein